MGSFIDRCLGICKVFSSYEEDMYQVNTQQNELNKTRRGEIEAERPARPRSIYQPESEENTLISSTFKVKLVEPWVSFIKGKFKFDKHWVNSIYMKIQHYHGFSPEEFTNFVQNAINSYDPKQAISEAQFEDLLRAIGNIFDFSNLDKEIVKNEFNNFCNQLMKSSTTESNTILVGYTKAIINELHILIEDLHSNSRP